MKGGGERGERVDRGGEEERVRRGDGRKRERKGKGEEGAMGRWRERRNEVLLL